MLLLLKIGCVLFDIPAVAVDLLALTGLGGRISSNITCIGDDRGTFQLYDVDTACVCLLAVAAGIMEFPSMRLIFISA